MQFHGRNDVALDFERADGMQKIRATLSELFLIQSKKFKRNQLGTVRDVDPSMLLGRKIHFEELIDIICIVLVELPSLLNIHEVIETLLYVNNSTTIICYIVANMPDRFKEVVAVLISNGDEETAEGHLRLNVLNALCDMNPGQVLPTRTLCVESRKMPSLILKLSLKDPTGLVSYKLLFKFDFFLIILNWIFSD